jgi:DNA-binding CsgD family transcriptional regulator
LTAKLVLVGSVEATEREAEVVRMVARGRTNREIGEVLHLSEMTVKGHVSKVLQRNGLSSRAALAGAAGLSVLQLDDPDARIANLVRACDTALNALRHGRGRVAMTALQSALRREELLTARAVR